MAKVKTATPERVEAENSSLYELMLILNPDLRESEVKKKLKELVEMIEKAGGRVTEEDFWGRRDLAYRLKKYNEGIYMVYNLELPNAFLKEFKEHLRIEKEVLRSMILKLSANYTYTKYDLDKPLEESERKEKTKRYPSRNENISIKHNSPIIAPKKKAEEVKEDKEEKAEENPASNDTAEPQGDAVETVQESSQEDKEEAKADSEKKDNAKKKKEEIDESELDRKLDAIIGGEDLNL